MPEVQIVLVNPLYEGNVGSTARVMKNFGWTRLALVDPCPLGNEAKAMASHAQDVLANARTVTLEEVVAESALVVATTGEVAQSVCSPVRMPYFSPARAPRGSWPTSTARSRSSSAGRTGASRTRSSAGPA